MFNLKQAKKVAGKTFNTVAVVSVMTLPLATLFVASVPAKAGVNEDFANGRVIELATPNNLRVNMYDNNNGASIFGLEADGSNDQKWVVEWQSGVGFKLRKQGTDTYLTVKDYPAKTLTLTEGWGRTGDGNVAATWVALPSNRTGYYNICLRAIRNQCLNLPNQKRLARFTTYLQDINDADQQIRPVGTPVDNTVVPPKDGNIFMLPFYGTTRVTQPVGGSYSHRDNLNKYAVDFGLFTGSPVASVARGTVVYAGFREGWGNVVVIKYDNYNGTVFGHYLHLNRINVSKNQRVIGGQQIGTAGTTWYSYKSVAPHLHYHEAAGMFQNSIPLKGFAEGVDLTRLGSITSRNSPRN